MTGAIEALHQQYPGRYLTDVDTSCNALFNFNPRITKLAEHDRTIELNYNLINMSDHRPCHFLQGFTDSLGAALGIPLACSVKRPYLYLSDEEKGWMNQVEQETGYKGKFWLLNAGWKNDYTVKKWRVDHWQEVVDKLRGKVQFVQVGELHHNHPPIKGTINLLGKTDLRQFIRLTYHAQGAITPESFLHHVMGAWQKPCITLCSGFLPVSWIAYHTGTILTHQQQMTCCADGRACWRSRVVPLNDNDSKDRNPCSLPVLGDDPTARCMSLITPDEVVGALMAYYFGGKLVF